MTELSDATRVDPELVANGIDQLEERYISSQERNAEKFLANAYMNGLALYQAHLIDTQQKIADAGGIKRVYTAERDGINGIECRDKTRIWASDILILPSVPLELPDSLPTSRIMPERPTYETYVELSAGGIGELAIGAVESPYDINDRPLFDSSTITDLLDGKPAPTTVAIKEVVAATSGIDNSIAVSGLIYVVSGQVWKAKLREEFSPDPYENPGAYNAWAAQEPIPRLDIGFSATPAPHRGRYYSVSGATFDHYTPLKPYYDHAGMLRMSIEGAKKMLRFGALLDVLWQNRFGVNMPTRGSQQVLCSPILETPELTT